MAKFFKMKSKDVKNFQKIMQRSPKKFAKASAGTLNDLAFKGKKEAPNIIAKLMTVRAKKFISSSVRVDKASRSAPLSRQSASFGTINRARFTGLKEQEEGSADKRKRIPTLAARRGARKRRVGPSLRIKSGIKVVRPGSRRGEMAAIAIARRNKSKEFLALNHLKSSPKGFYRFFGKKLRLVSRTEGLGKRVRKRDWMEKTINELNKDNVIISSWKKNIKREFKL